MSTAAPRADAAASSVGARDLFVLRRVTGARFVHFGGSGRGAGWAGLIEVSSDEEASLGNALQSRRPVRLEHADEGLVFGPYYARKAAFVPVTNDVVVVFGANDESLGDAGDEQLSSAAQLAADAVESVTPAKRLADELEELEAVRAVVTAAFDDTREAMFELARIAAESLSCEVGAIYIADGDRLEVIERGFALGLTHDQLQDVLKGVLEEARFPFCVQDASVVPLPGLLGDEAGIRSYYLLELTGLARGVLFLAHTDAAPRGFTLLCRRLGLRLAEVTTVQLGVALTREWCRREAARLDAEFARLEASG
jgi:hypothetical protein